MSAQEIKIPLLCQATHLKALPAQAEGSRYAVCWGAGMPEPEGGLGYLIDFTGKRTGYVIAWIQDGGYVYACDGYLDVIPEREPDLSVARWRSNPRTGRIALHTPGGEERQVTEYKQLDDGSYAFVDPVSDLGPVYSASAVNLRQMLAVAFLAFWHLPRRADAGAASGKRMGEVLTAFLDLPPADAIDAFLGEVKRGERTSGFERYAARILTDADPVTLRALTARHEVSLRRLRTTGLFWFACDVDELNEEEFDALTTMEGALNRLALIARRAHENGADDLSAASEAYCADEDWRSVRAITDQTAPYLKQAAYTDNRLLNLFGTLGERGGEWDLRTRVAILLEELALPFRLTYRFSADASQGTVTITAKVPGAQAMPRWVRAQAPGEEGSPLADCSGHAEVAASAYALRLATALATVGFSASAGVGGVRVVLCEDRAFEHPLLRMDVDREGFIMSVYDVVRKGVLSEPRLTWSVSGIKEQLLAARLTFTLNERLGLEPLALPEDELTDPDAARTCSVWEDTRSLTPELAEFLHAERVCDLDVYHLGEDPFVGRLREAIALAEGRPAEAAQQLSDLLGVMSLMDEDTGLRPLYCASGASRLAMALVDDDPAARYRYVYDSQYDAYVSLANLCTDNGDAEHGAAYAEQAIELGPTSPSAYIAAATAESKLGELEKAAEHLKCALRFDVNPASFTYTYYRLAFVLWRMADYRTSLACYQRALPNPRLREMVEEEMRDLMTAASVESRLEPEDVRGILDAAEIPIAPSDEILEVAARATVLAADAGFLNLAHSYGQVLSRVVGDDAFASTLASMRPRKPMH